jgi:hypothetical protein
MAATRGRSLASPIRSANSSRLHVGEDRRVDPERGELLEEKRPVAIRQSARREGLERAVSGDQARGRLRADAREARIAVGRVADEGEVVGHPLRRDAELLADALGVADLSAPAIDLDDPIRDDALGEILVGRPDADPLDARVSGRPVGRRGEGVVGLELDHRPHDDAHGGQGLLERMELGPQRRIDALARLVVRPQFVAERLDDVIRRHAQMRGPALDHLRHRMEHARDRAEGRVDSAAAPDAVEVAEELVGPVEKMGDHCGFRASRKAAPPGRIPGPEPAGGGRPGRVKSARSGGSFLS